MPALIRECKNEKGYGVNEAIAYYGNYLINALQDYSEYNTRFPYLLFVDIRTQVGFYGAVWDGLHIRVEPLTRGFDLTTPWKEKQGRYEMASILDALVETTKFIENHYASIFEQKDDKFCRKYPFLSSYRDDVEQKDVGFIYDAQLGEDKLLFSATTDTKEPIVIKFTMQYSVDAHKHLAQLGVTPRIRQSIRISAEWLAIIMDWSNYTSLYELGCRLSKPQRDKVRSRVRDIVQELHRGCFVHGDIRDANFLVDIASLEDDVVRVHLIDFDWAGRIGEAKYPSGLNYTTVKRPKEVLRVPYGETSAWECEIIILLVDSDDTVIEKMNLCRRLAASTSLVRTYATRYRRPKPGTAERPAVRVPDPLANNPQAVVTSLEDEDLTFIHRPPPTAPSPFSLSTNPTSPLLQPPTPVTTAPLPPLIRKEVPMPDRASDKVVAQIRRLRRSDPNTYTRLKLAEMFGVTSNFVGAIAALKSSARRARFRLDAEKQEKLREKWSERKITARAIRAKRQQFW
ncbi:hypothetical protein C0993_010077 [Termitomyces sp. T159_Od127]|nr:hypothetical protein C0993_010077 [Termitomyces sp. T159_Od127]